MTVHRRPAERPSAQQACQCKIPQPTGMASQRQLEVISAGNRIVTHACEAETTKAVNKDEHGKQNFFCIRVVYSLDWINCYVIYWYVMLIVMSTNLENRGKERQKKRESRRRASEAQREKERQRATAKDKKQRRNFLVEEEHENFVAAVRK